MTEKKFDHIDKAKRNLDTGTSVFLARATEGTSLYVSLRQLVSAFLFSKLIIGNF